jgi:type II restriction enzyme
MDDKIAEQYKSNSQKIRVITEQWVNNNLFCQYCGKAHITYFENNRPVADFFVRIVQRNMNYVLGG